MFFHWLIELTFLMSHVVYICLFVLIDKSKCQIKSQGLQELMIYLPIVKIFPDLTYSLFGLNCSPAFVPTHAAVVERTAGIIISGEVFLDFAINFKKFATVAERNSQTWNFIFVVLSKLKRFLGADSLFYFFYKTMPS